uniref:Putative flap endonuclease gen-like protein n=1 Tax=Triatoma infestans TaxID=30076 RepID=A0A023EZN5_TRIIF
MGVKDLWSILSPVCEKKSLWELQGQTIAIDLSAWICDSQSLNKQPQVNMYLRNLFFRTSYLLLLGVKPVFVLEGKAPDLKANTIKSRLNKNINSVNGNQPGKGVNRSRLKSLQKQCTELLSYLGLTCIEAPGEAEAFCAHLNKQGLVHGVITQDSDAFLYGAREVYRNFQMAPKYTCDAYSMDKIEEKLALSRTKLIGFSILCGSDYNNGLKNIGKETALKFLTSVPDELLFQRFLLWKHDATYFSSKNQAPLSKEMEIEVAIREKALQDKNFPNFDVIAEFNSEPNSLHLEYSWDKPQLTKFLFLANKKLMWDEEYSMKKMAPLLGRWHLENNGTNCNVTIVSIGTAHGKESYYKVTWDLFDVVTTERKDLVKKVYPHLVAEYEENRAKKTRKLPKRRRKQNCEMEDELMIGKVTTKSTLLNVLIPHQLNIDKSASNSNSILFDDNYLNLSGIIEDIVTRPNSNPAINHLSKLL